MSVRNIITTLVNKIGDLSGNGITESSLAIAVKNDRTQLAESPNYPILDTEVGVTNKHFNYGDVRRYGAIGDGVILDATAFTNSIASTGYAFLENKSYRVDDLVFQRDNVNIIGAKMPTYSGDLSKLQNGTILKGSLIIDGSHIAVKNFGVDRGTEYTTTYKNGIGNNAIVIHKIAQDGTVNYNCCVENIIGLVLPGLNTDSNTAFHAVLLESLDGGIADNAVGVGGWFGVVLKVSNFKCGKLTGVENDTASVNLKSNSYGTVSNVSIDQIASQNTTARGFCGVLIQASDAEMSNVHIGKIISTGGYLGCRIESEASQPIKNLNISQVVCSDNHVGMDARGAIYSSVIDDIIINNPSIGLGFETTQNSASVYLTDLHIGTMRVVAPAGTESSNHVRLLGNVSFDYIKCTVGYVTKGNIYIEGRNRIGDYFGKLSINLKKANLLNGWVSSYEQECGSYTKNGRTKFFGRVNGNARTSEIFCNLSESARPLNLELYAYALGYDGVSSTFKTTIPVKISATGDVSIPNAGLFGALSWIELCSIDIPNDMDETGGI